MAAAWRRSVVLFGEKFSQISSKIALPDKLKGGRIEKGVNYLKLIRDDYKTALQDGVVDAKARPYKAAVYGAGENPSSPKISFSYGRQIHVVAVTSAAIATNPSMDTFLDQRIEWCNEMALVGKATRNRISEDHLREINRLLNQKRLEVYDLIVCSLLIRESQDPQCELYPAQCSFLQPTYFEMLTERVVDFGAFGRWWLIDRMMRDYDVNDEEIRASTLAHRF
ncbi:mitochondrial import inner membrane translocase subunit Tim29 [Galendromus occidentalis]|uniref:Mitochondrial import inner membrane translocase subunit Tim29 n=1 Tax=Galendromus occidentalis TaxID=34638 RepID=A0AAJ7WH32_9ACAR|nr:mitochondrial import inner membrane translocase subunit Tim29 [Galendromus occidentalis]